MLLGKVAERSAESRSSEANHAKPKYQRPPHVTSSRNGTGIPLFLHGRSEETSETSKEDPVEAWDVLFFQLCYIASIYDHVYFLDIYYMYISKICMFRCSCASAAISRPFFLATGGSSDLYVNAVWQFA